MGCFMRPATCCTNAQSDIPLPESPSPFLLSRVTRTDVKHMPRKTYVTWDALPCLSILFISCSTFRRSFLVDRRCNSAIRNHPTRNDAHPPPHRVLLTWLKQLKAILLAILLSHLIASLSLYVLLISASTGFFVNCCRNLRVSRGDTPSGI